jgi:membrane protein DedA with SNARE-associated domain
MSYLILFLVAAGFAMIPLPLFPSWVVVAYMIVQFDLSRWMAIFVGALGTTLGRVILVAVSRVAGHRMLGKWSQQNLPRPDIAGGQKKAPPIAPPPAANTGWGKASVTD